MTMIKNSPVIEWQLGRLELGRTLQESSNGEWSVLEPFDLHWYGINQEAHRVGSFLGASNQLFDGQKGIAHVLRPTKKRIPPSVTCFAELPTHYVTNAWDEIDCRTILDSARHAFDSSKPVLCRGGYDGLGVVVLSVYPADPEWIGAVYALRMEEKIDPNGDVRDPSIRAKVRSTLVANQAIWDRFILDPFTQRGDATCEGLVSADGEISSLPEGWTFDGLLATPSPATTGPGPNSEVR